jgi:hypothetical protein
MENSIEKYLKRKVEKNGGICLKFVSPGYTGVPDRLCIFKNKFFFVETKDTGKELRPRQLFVKKILESFGLKVYKADSKEIVNEILSKELSNIRN